MAESAIATTVGILSAITGCVILYITFLILLKYREKRQKATIYVFFSVLSWSFTSFAASIVYFTADNDLDIAHIVQVFMYVSVFSATIFTYMFARKIFFTEKTKFYIYYVILGIVAIIVIGFADSSDVVYFPDSEGYPALILKMEFSIILVLYLIPTILRITYDAFRSAKKMEEKIYRMGFMLIGYGQIFILLVFVCDTIAGFLLHDAGLYGFFIYMQWIFAMVSACCLYVGWTMPAWFKKLYGLNET